MSEQAMLDYRPCRVINCYSIEGNHVKVVTFNNIIKLDSAGMVFWLHADGKHSIREIIDILSKRFPNSTEENLKKGVLTLTRSLQERGVLIANWDPILKEELPQEVIL